MRRLMPLNRTSRRLTAGITTTVAVGAVVVAMAGGALTAGGAGAVPAGGSGAMAAGGSHALAPAAVGSLLRGPGRGSGGVRAAAAAPTVTRLQGANRFATAAVIAEDSSATAANVIVANGFTPADALAGAYLAGYLKAPILLTGVDTTPPETLAAISQLQAQNVYVLGGSLAVSDAQLAALGQITSTGSGGGKLKVTRVAGADRYATAAAIDTTPPAAGVGTVAGVPTALVANGITFPDALAGGALAAGASLPMVLTDGSQLSPPAGQTLQTLGIKQVEILGGTAAVSAAVASSISALGITVNRLSGADRTETALDIAGFAGSELGFTPSPSTDCTSDPTSGTVCAFPNLYVARGDNAGGGVDALALGPLAGKGKTPILLTATADDPSAATYGEAALSAGASVLQGLTVAGGPLAVSAANLVFLTDAVGGGTNPPFNASPTTVAPGGTISIDDAGNACPAAPAGTDAFNAAALVPLSNGSSTTTTTVTGPTTTLAGTTTTTVAPAGNQPIELFTGPAPLSGGHWSAAITIDSATAAGQYGLVAYCAADFAPADPTKYSYQDYEPILITVS